MLTASNVDADLKLWLTLAFAHRLLIAKSLDPVSTALYETVSYDFVCFAHNARGCKY